MATYFGEISERYEAQARAFAEKFPQDARRWNAQLTVISLQGARRQLGLPARPDAEIDATLEAILNDATSPEGAKAGASFLRVSRAVRDEAKFRQLAQEHLKTFPESQGNERLKKTLASMDEKAKAAQALREKPLELAFTAVDGTAIDLNQLRGKVVLIDFWATWCGPCMRELPQVREAYEKLHSRGFEIVGISFDKDREKLVAVTAQEKMTWPQYFDGKGWENDFGRRFGIRSIPTMWLVNKKGMVVDTEARENLADKVEKLLAE
jgi:thiol-disulfide isomerase/thioredoxin